MNYVANLEDALLCSDDDKNLAKPLRVSQLVNMLKRDVEDKHRFVRVIGEVSSFKQWRSGHCYFDVKDDEALLPAVMFKPHFARLPFVVKDGMEMVFSGKVSIYSANARLQMIVENMEPLGQGALAMAFEQMKERLKNEGLFDAQHKKPIKTFNHTVGIITSSHGAVLRDMVRILKTRMPKVDILFVPVRVQGAGAALEIKNALEFLDGLGACDVIIVGRGGGSLEDLWAFNEEIVARAIFAATTPIISAVGHETDTTISDFVADVRAATPTHAATMAVPQYEDILLHVDAASSTLKMHLASTIQRAKLAVAHEKRRLKDPRVVLFRHVQRLDNLTKRLDGIMAVRIKERVAELDAVHKSLKLYAPFRQLRLKREAVTQYKAQLAACTPARGLRDARSSVDETKRSLDTSMHKKFVRGKESFLELLTKLDALSPLRVLSRGYSMLEDDQGLVLSRAAQFTPGQMIHLRLEDGVVTASVTTITTGVTDGKNV